HKTQVQFISQNRTDDKAACIHTRHQIQLLPHVTVDKQVNQHPEGTRVLQNRGDISERHPWLWPVRHIANDLTDVLGGINLHVKASTTKNPGAKGALGYVASVHNWAAATRARPACARKLY